MAGAERSRALRADAARGDAVWGDAVCADAVCADAVCADAAREDELRRNRLLELARVVELVADKGAQPSRVAREREARGDVFDRLAVALRVGEVEGDDRERGAVT